MRQNQAVAVAALLIAIVAMGLAVVDRIDRPRYGYTHAGELLAGHAPAVEIQREIEAELAPLRDKLQAQREATESLAARLADPSAVTREEAAALQPRLLLAMQRQAQLEASLDALAAQLEDQRMAPVRADLDAAIREFAEHEGYTMIWAVTTSGNLAYASEAANVTDEFLGWLARNPPAPPAVPPSADR